MQAYEDVLERYKGEAAAGPALAGAGGPRLGRLQVGRRAGGASPRAGLGRELRPPLGAGFWRVEIRSLGSPAPRPALGALLSPVTLFALLSGRI